MKRYLILQFLDMFNYLSEEEVIENAKLLKDYCIKHLEQRPFIKYASQHSEKILHLLILGGLIDATGSRYQ